MSLCHIYSLRQGTSIVITFTSILLRCQIIFLFPYFLWHHHHHYLHKLLMTIFRLFVLFIALAFFFSSLLILYEYHLHQSRSSIVMSKAQLCSSMRDQRTRHGHRRKWGSKFVWYTWYWSDKTNITRLLRINVWGVGKWWYSLPWPGRCYLKFICLLNFPMHRGQGIKWRNQLTPIFTGSCIFTDLWWHCNVKNSVCLSNINNIRSFCYRIPNGVRTFDIWSTARVARFDGLEMQGGKPAF